MIKAIIFDMDGLMFDSERLSMIASDRALQAMGVQGHDGLFLRAIGMNNTTVRGIYIEELGADFDYGAWHEIFCTELESITKSGLPVKSGLFELVKYINERKIKRAIASSSDRERVRLFVNMAGLLPDFPVRICGDMIVNGKPDPEIFFMALEAVGVSREECLILEDSPAGILAAHRAGIRSVMVPDLQPPTDAERRMAYRIVSSLHDVIPILEENDAL